MQDSHNVLRIDSIEGDNPNEFFGEFDIYPQFRISLNYSIRMNCPIVGCEFRRLEFTTEGIALDEQDAFKDAVQNMLNGRHNGARDNISMVEHKCKPVKGVHHLDVQFLPKELQDMFRQLFDISSWEFELKTLN